MEQQYRASRKQHVSFTPEHAEEINESFRIIEEHGGKPSVAKFVKAASVERAKDVLGKGKKK
tara:strand:+ start:821 stop:1006 length:186 start_codon:yes stop_codon:yes gene_type:complete